MTYPDGRRTTGKVASITASTLQLDPQPRPFRRRGPALSVAETSVATVAQMDSLWQGMLLGFAAGYVPTAVLGCAQENGRGGGECTGAVYLAGPVVGLLGMGIGGWIDGRRNDIVYRAAARQATALARILVAPVVTQGRRGVLLSVPF